MANSILTLSAITREGVRLFINTNAFIRNLDRQYDASFAQAGAKIGQTLRIRLPNDYTVNFGANASVQDTVEQQINLPVATQANVSVGFNSVERTMSMDDYAERVIAPMMNNLVGKVAATIMATVDGGAGVAGVCNIVGNVSGSTVNSPILDTFLAAEALLDDNSAPPMDRLVVNDPTTNARTVAALAGLFNPVQEISQQYRSGQMARAVGFDWFKDQTVIKHTSGTYDGNATVNGGSQTGSTILVTGGTGTLAAGDIITFGGVNAVNRTTKTTTGALRQFVVTTAQTTGFTSVPIYPALTPPIGGNDVQYETVTASPLGGAAVKFAVAPASTTYRKSISFAPEAITMVTADLELPGSSASEEAREVFDGVSMRAATQWQVGTDQKITRTDVLFGSLIIRPEWCCAIIDKI